jgi:hypothetical protein
VSSGKRETFQSLGSLEETMIPRLITSGVLPAIAGAAMTVALSSSPSFAFTPASPYVTEQGLKTDVQEIYYYHRYYYRPYYHHYYHPYYHHYYRHYYYRPYYHRYYRPYYYHRYYYHPYYYHPYYYHRYYYPLY